jgi:c-di-GMP-related signal transduction protein
MCWTSTADCTWGDNRQVSRPATGHFASNVNCLCPASDGTGVSHFLSVDEPLPGPIQPADPTGAGLTTRFLARQPILDKHQRIYGYELLYRSSTENSFTGDTNMATRDMVDNFLVNGIDSLSAGSRIFFNCSEESLVEGLVTLLPPKSTVLELLETVEPTPEVVAACREFKKKGYQLALDDFHYRDAMRPLIDLADFIKIDFLELNAQSRQEMRRRIGRTRAAMLAEKIETHAEFQHARDEGFEYFQGYFFCRPILESHTEIPPNMLGHVRLLAAISKSPFDVGELEKILQSDASMTYRLLRLVNSAAYGLSREIHSIRSALIMVGDEEFRKLVSVALTKAMGSGRPDALIPMALTRARFCELLAPHIGQKPSEQYLVGLLSLIDAVLKLPMEQVVQRLPLRAAAKAALLGENNVEASGLCILRSYETGSWSECMSRVNGTQVSPEVLSKLYVEAVAWSEQTLRAI